MKKLALFILVIILGIGWEAWPTKRTCQEPQLTQRWHCRKMEQAILEATVRIAFHGRLEIENGYEVQEIKGTISHATVVDGRYLITHNHFGIPLSQVQIYNRHANGGFAGISVYRFDGTILLDHAPLDVFTVAAEEGETVLLDFGTVGDEGFFAHNGIPSAQVARADGLQLPPGAEIALIDWDGQGHTRVVWTQIVTVYEENQLPLLLVDHFIELGASGGGVFIDGRHIGNSWGRIIYPNTKVEGHESLVALNL